MNRKITDAGVAGLRIDEGRAELLDEIMAITLSDESTDTLAASPQPRHRRWIPALGAAAAVAAMIGGVVWLGGLGGDRTVEDPLITTPTSVGKIAVLEVDDWPLVDASLEGMDGGSLSYENGTQMLDIYWRPAAEYNAAVEDHNSNGRSRPLTVLGRSALNWSSSAEDHTTITVVDGDFLLEIRGQGMEESAYLALLDHLVAIEPADLDRRLPPSFITDAERPLEISAMLSSVPLPDDFDKAIDTQEVSRYGLIVDVVAAVTCAWVEQFEMATVNGDDEAAKEARLALGTSRTWPMLREMDPEDFPSVVWDVSDQVGRGQVPQEYRAEIGCDG